MSDDLISRSALTKSMLQYVRGEKTIGQIIDEQPTAYYTDKVVKKIQELGTRFCANACCDTECKNCEHAAIMRGVIDIVKRGGV